MNLTQSVSSLSIPQQHSGTARRLSSSLSDVDPNCTSFRVGESALTKSFASNSQSIESDYSDLDGPQRKQTWFKRTVQVASSVMECSLGTLRAESNTQLRISAEMDDLTVYNEQDQGEHETSYTVYPAGWLIQLGIRYGLRLQFGSSATQGWKTALKSFCPVPDDALIFEFCRQGNTSAVRELLSREYASARDTDSRGYTPLHVSLLDHGPLLFVKISNARVKFAAQNYHPELCEMLKSAGADINALTYGSPGRCARLALFYPQKAIKTDMIVRTPMLLASDSTKYVTYTTLSNASDTLRLLTDSMDFSDLETGGWLVLYELCNNIAYTWGETKAKEALLLWMLKLLTYELRANYIRTEFSWLLNCTLYSLEPAANLLLKLGDADLIDGARNGTGGYSALHERLADSLDPTKVLAKGPNLHLLGFDKEYTPEKESPMSLAMYSSWAFVHWRDGLVGIEVDLSTFIDQELESNAFVHPGWDKGTLRDLFEYHVRPELCWSQSGPCIHCDKLMWLIVQPYWRHLLERIKQRIDPDDPFQRDSGVDETQTSNIRSGMEASNDSDHELDISGSVSLDEFKDDVGSEAEFKSEVQLGSGVHGYPENVPIRSNCMYRRNDFLCMDCWLHYRRTGTRFEVEDSSIDEHASSEEESSDDEFSPYHIHS